MSGLKVIETSTPTSVVLNLYRSAATDESMIYWILAMVVGIATLTYLHFQGVYSYWERRGLPQPPIVWGFGNIFDAFISKSAVGQIYTNIYRTFSDQEAVGVCGCNTPKLLVRSPELIQRVMVSDFSSFHDNEFYVSKKVDPYFYHDPFVLKGEEWKPARTKLTTTMTSVRTKEIFPLMKEIIPRLDNYINDCLGKDVKVKELADLFTMDNVSNTVFGINSNCFSDPEAAFRKVADIQMKDHLQSWWKTVILKLLPKIRDLIRLKFIPSSVSDYVKALVKDVMEFRQKNKVNRNDLFNYFMKKETGADVEEIMFYGMTFFIEGFETSAMTASSALYELAMNPGVQQTLYEKVRDVFSDKPEINYDTIIDLPYLDKVLKETMRKYPIMYSYNRECTKPVTLSIGGKPVDVEPGTPIIVPVFAVHRDPQYYPNPDKFDPERFSEENLGARPQYTYMPFGEGPRICPGMRFGLTQVKLLLSNVVYKWRILRTEKTPQSLTFQTATTMVVPNEDVWVKFEKRK